MSVQVIQGDARKLDMLDDASVDLIVTSPPYWALRSYTDGGAHYGGQLGAEATPAEYVDSLIECTREWLRVLKATGSLWVNLGDKYATRYASTRSGGRAGLNHDDDRRSRTGQNRTGVPEKSLIGLPWRYALRCVDELGLILRAEVIWSKPNGLPESVTDRVRRSHETWFHFTRAPRYYAAVDAIRETYAPATAARYASGYTANSRSAAKQQSTPSVPLGVDNLATNPLGKLPGSVWTIATQPLKVPAEIGVDHFAAFPMEWPRRIVLGWSPSGICTACGQGRRPVTSRSAEQNASSVQGARDRVAATGGAITGGTQQSTLRGVTTRAITGEACGCPDTSAPTRPAVVLDPFGGTGTTALVASVHGRDGISVDMSADYCRVARWRTGDAKQRERAARAAGTKPLSTPSS